MFDLTSRVERAAQLVAAGDLSLEAIAQEVGVTSRTLRNWRGREAFGRRVEEIRAESRRHGRGLAGRERPAVAYLVVLAGRGGRGDDAAELVPLYALDGGQLRKLRELEGRSPRDLCRSEPEREPTSEDESLPPTSPEAAIAEVHGEAASGAGPREQEINDDRI